jgi:hypothetical protein
MPKYVLMLDSLAAEFAPVDKGAMAEHVEKFRAGWDQVKRQAGPSSHESV